MKYLLILFVSTAAFIAVEAKLPEYIHNCKRNDPKFNQCVVDSMHNLREKLAVGIPELGAKRIDPLHLDTLALNLGPGISAVGNGLQLTGLKNYEIKNMDANLDTDIISFNFIIPEGKVQGDYALKVKLASIPLEGKGPIIINAKSILGRVKIHGKKVNHHGETKYYFKSMDLELKVTDASIKLQNLFEGAAEIGEIINRLLNEEKAEVLASILPTIEKVMTKECLDYANKLVSPFTYDELFPSA